MAVSERRIVPTSPSWLDKPLKVKRGGKSVRMHPHEATMISLGKRALKGEPRAAKEFLKECAIAGLLSPQQLEQDARRDRGTARC